MDSMSNYFKELEIEMDTKRREDLDRSTRQIPAIKIIQDDIVLDNELNFSTEQVKNKSKN